MVDKEEEECQKILKLKDYYEILGIDKNADETQIKKAYRKLAIKFHPDKNKSKSAEEAFKKVNQAFSTLSNKEKRKHYDMFGTDGDNVGFNGGMEFDPFDVFNMFFGGMEGFSTNSQNRGRQNGRTRIQFRNGNGSFTVFTSSGFGPFGNFSSASFGDDDENEDDGGDIFDQLFRNNFGTARNRHQSNSNNNNQQRTHKNRGRNREMNEHERNIKRTVEQITYCIQLCPLICCLIFVIIPFFFRVLLQ